MAICNCNRNRIFLLRVAIISCFASLSLSSTFTHDNPIRFVSDGQDYIRDDLSSLPSPPIESMYQFGDSIADTGNLILDDPEKGPFTNFANFPYGETFFHHPTGRCSDGLLITDYFATSLNLPFLDPYLKKDGNFSHGVNFAVAGSTALDASTLAAKNILSPITNRSLSVQLGWFKSHLHSICSHPSECKEKLAKALFVVGEIGGNDYNWAFFQRKTMAEVYQLVPEVVRAIETTVKEVINLGALRVVVPGNFPIGCMTIYLALFKTDDLTMYDELKCLKHLNSFAKFHNDQLQQAIRELQKDHPDVAIVYADYFMALKAILQHATSLGFDKDAVFKACCGIGDNDYNFDSNRSCGSDGVPVCQNPLDHVNWDGVHLTQHAYQVMANWLMRDILHGISSTASTSTDPSLARSLSGVVASLAQLEL